MENILLENEFLDGSYRYGRVIDNSTLTKVFELRYDIYATEYGFEPENEFGQEKDEWDDFSVHFVCLDSENNVVGTVRNVIDYGYGLPIDFTEKLKIDPLIRRSHICSEISRFAVSKKMRMSGCSYNLLKCVGDYCDDNSIDGILFLTEMGIINSYIRMGLDVKLIGDSEFIHGRYRTPCLVTDWQGVIK